MYNHNKAQQSKNRVHISWDFLGLGDVIYLRPQTITPNEYTLLK